MSEKKLVKTAKTAKTSEEMAREEEAAEIHRAAKESALDETVPGGRYMVDGKTVNAEGEEI